MAIRSSIVGWKILDRGAWWATVPGLQEPDTTEHTHTNQYSVLFALLVAVAI